MPQQQETTLPKEKFHHYKENIYILKPRDCTIEELLDKPIYRYINFDMLYQLLNGKLIVWRKGGMSDKHEAGDLYNPFIDSFTSVGDKPTDKQKRRWKVLKELRKSTACWLTTCFTSDANDDYFFWKCYTSNFLGCRYKTTLRRFINNIDLGNNYELYIGIIDYKHYETWPSGGLTEYAFSKTISYQRENELRLYFLPKAPQIILDNSVPNTFCINSNLMIENILFTPFSSNIQRQTLREIFKSWFPMFTLQSSFFKIIETI
ncbi:MAG: hypothetical protein K2H63_10085 [Paramuribaculum sp.]|nr:hypothetical protein [Paramuribaculum sp.]